MAWFISSDEREELTTKNTLPSKTLLQIWWRNQKLSRQAKIKRIQHHQTSFTTNAKGTSLGRKHKRRERPTENKPQTIKKTVIGLYISISSVQFSHSVMSDSLQPHEPQHARQASLSITISRSPSKPMSIESVMPSRHLILCCPPGNYNKIIDETLGFGLSWSQYSKRGKLSQKKGGNIQ